MDEQTTIPLPAVPGSDADTPHISLPDRDEAIPNLGTLLVGPGDIDAGSFLFSPGVVPATVLGYALGGERTLSDIEAILRKRASLNEPGKISKYDSFYAPQTPIPFGVWEYKCETCRFYEEDGGQNGDGPQCGIVGHESDWFGGENVHPSGWCALWMPNPGRGWLEYATDRLEGRDGE